MDEQENIGEKENIKKQEKADISQNNNTVKRLKIPDNMINDPLRVKLRGKKRQTIPPTPAFRVFSILSWVIAITGVLLFVAAKPVTDSVISVLRGVQSRPLPKIWNAGLLSASFFVMLTDIPICITSGIILLKNEKRISYNAVKYFILGCLTGIMSAVLYLLW